MSGVVEWILEEGGDETRALLTGSFFDDLARHDDGRANDRLDGVLLDVPPQTSITTAT